MGKILVLCVDRDDDIGQKTGLSTPLLGEKDNLKAAQALAIADPSESDVNAIYQAVKTYRQLIGEGEDVDIATVSGHRTRGSKADREVSKKIESLLEEGYSSVVLVSDGADDEQVLPIIESRTKIEFVETVIVKQTKELEKSYHVIKTALKDPYFARIIFGIPGLIISIWALTSLFGMEEETVRIAFIVAGAYLTIRGFGIEDLLSKGFTTFKKTTSVERASFPLYMGSIVILLFSLWAGYDFAGKTVAGNLASNNVSLDTAGTIFVLGAGFLHGLITLFTLGVLLFFAGRMGDMYYGKKVHRIKKYARSMISVMALALIVYFGTQVVLYWNGGLSSGPTINELLIWVLISVIFTLAGFSVIKYLYIKRYVQPRLKKGLKVKDLSNKELGEISFIDYNKRYFFYSDDEDRERVRFGQVIRVKDSVFIHH